MLAVTTASRSETGGRTLNEDHLHHGQLDSGWLAVLADGAGGHRNGAVASECVVRTARHHIEQHAAQQPPIPLPPAELGHAVHRAHEALNSQQVGLRGHERMHATLVVLWIDRARQHALWSHAGDSRLYVLRQGRIVHVTHDDSVVQGMVDAGLMAPAQARQHPQRHQLAAALGSVEPIMPHCCNAALALHDGDAFLLCSDGWHDAMDDAEIEASLALASSADDWLGTMQHSIQAGQHPNQDNYSAIAVWVGNPAEITRIRGPHTPA